MSPANSGQDLPIAPNRPQAQTVPVQLGQVWVADITSEETAEGWLYVAGVQDRCSRRRVGWAMGYSLAPPCRWRPGTWPSLTAGLRPAWFTTATGASNTPAWPGGNDWLGSMSRRGKCHDNAVLESVWSSLKRELIHHRQFQTRTEAQADPCERLEVFCNRERFRSALDYQSPVDFELNLNIQTNDSCAWPDVHQTEARQVKS